MTITDQPELTRPIPPPIPRSLLALLLATAVLVVLACIARQVVSWHNFGDLEDEGGIWTTLAIDAAHGTIYRPIISPLGYGGTRYGPLHFLLHSALLTSGLPPIPAGFLIGITSCILTLVGIYVVMRKLQTPRPLALALTSFFLGAFCVRSGILSIKADLLAAALDVWGLVAALPLTSDQPGNKKWLSAILAGVCFALATATKITSLFGIATIVTWFLLHRDFKNAARVLLCFLIAAGAIIATVQFASQGRAAHIFLVSASGGGGFKRFLEAPRHFIHVTANRDRAVGAFFLTAMIALLANRRWISLPTILMAYSFLGTFAILGSAGTDMNHLMDLQIASLIAIAVGCRSGNLSRWLLVAVTLVSLHAAHSCIKDIHEIRSNPPRQQFLACIADIRNSPVDGPIFSENPIIPILAGQRPYMLDCVIFSVIDVHHPHTHDKLVDDLTRHRFRAFIVTTDLTYNTMATPTDPWPAYLAFMRTKYHLAASEAKNRVYLPNLP